MRIDILHHVCVRNFLCKLELFVAVVRLLVVVMVCMQVSMCVYCSTPCRLCRAVGLRLDHVAFVSSWRVFGSAAGFVEFAIDVVIAT